MQWSQAAIYSINQGDWETAISICQQVLSQQPNLVQAYQIWGQALQQQANFTAAIQCYVQALSTQPDKSQIYLELGNIYQQQQQWQDAIICYQTVIRLQPHCLIAYRQLGQILLHLEEWEAVVDVYYKLIQLSPQVSWFYNHLGKALMKLKQWEEAVNAYQASVTLNPDFCWSYYHLSQCFIQLEKWEEAENILKEGIQNDAKHELIYQALVHILQQRNKKNEVIETYKKLIEINPCIAYYISLGKIFINQQQLEKATEVLIQALYFQPMRYELFILLGDILKQQGFTLESLECKYSMKIPIFWIKQYFNLTHDYTTTTDSDSNIQRNVIYPSSTIEFSPPKTLESNIPPGFQIQETNLQEVFVATLENGRVWSDSLTHAVITSNNQIVSDLSVGCPELILSSNKLPNPLYLEGKVAFLSAQFGLIYYHWMLDVIPRIYLLYQQGFSIDKIDYFVVNRHRNHYEKEILKTLGIPQYKIIESWEHPYIAASCLLIPFLSRKNAEPPPLWEVEFLKNQFLYNHYVISSSQHRIYISRSQAKVRKVINEATVIEVLQQYGFQTIQFELMSVEEQANAMAEAEVIIAPHGSGLTNLVFCNSGTKVIEILSPSWLNTCYWALSQTCHLDYFCLVAEPSLEDQFKLTQHQDYYVNIQKLQQLMKLAEVI